MRKFHNKDNNLAEYLFHEGTNYCSYEYLGSHIIDEYCVFRVWAPNAHDVYVTGTFNNWEKYTHKAYRITEGGIFECIVEGVKEFDSYKYIIITENGDELYKADPYGYHCETRPGTASRVYDLCGYEWNDKKWMENRKAPYNEAVSIYEMHLGSWRRYADGNTFSYEKIAEELIPYVKGMGFTHIELMPVSEYPYDKSWGYQVTGYYAPTSRYGTPKDFMKFIDLCHQNDIGVILDWVPAHFPKDAHGLYEFDGTYCYEYADPLKREHPDWGTRIFDYEKNEVKCFLISNACYWLDKYHIDGLRVDAVASMLYLNFSRENWLPNKYGGSENLEAIEFLKRTNTIIHSEFTGAITIAEESTTFKGVTAPVKEGGLGFDLKWNLGWMHDTLDYLKENPVHRKYHHNKMTFPSMFQFTEKFMLVYSHDEVVHGKSPMVGKMGSPYWDDKLATLRALYAYMWFWPGKKTLFMGDEIAQGHEWRYDESLEWSLLKYSQHRGVQAVVADAARLYLTDKKLAENDFNPIGFEWINADDGDNSVYSFLRFDSDGRTCYAIVSNFTPVERCGYRIGLPWHGQWHEVLNTDATCYSGDGRGNCGMIRATDEIHADGRPFGADIVVPPLSTLVFRRVLADDEDGTVLPKVSKSTDETSVEIKKTEK